MPDTLCPFRSAKMAGRIRRSDIATISRCYREVSVSQPANHPGTGQAHAQNPVGNRQGGKSRSLSIITQLIVIDI